MTDIVPDAPKDLHHGGWGLALRLARREIRGGLSGFRILIACLALGVAAIGAIGSLSAGIQDALRADARKLLGGDLEVRLVHRDATAAQRAWLRQRATVSSVVEARAMVYPAEKTEKTTPPKAVSRLLVELRAVDHAYPLIGALRLRTKDGKTIDASASQIKALLRVPIDGQKGDTKLYGALVDPMVLTRLNLRIGDHLSLGKVQLVIRGTITAEPDRSTRFITLGPRVLIARDALAASDLLQPGALFYFRYRLRLAAPDTAAEVTRQIKAAFPDAGWRIRSISDATRGLRRFLNQLALYLSLVGLTALLVGGMGVANGARAFLEGRIPTIATLKCLGAPAALIFRLYLIQMLLISGLGIAIGLGLAATLPLLLSNLFGSLLPVAIPTKVYLLPLAIAAAFGFLTSLTFSLRALARAREVPAASLFRHAVAALNVSPRPIYLLFSIALVGLLTGLVLLTAADRMTALIFLVACACAFVVFRLIATAIAATARLLANKPAIVSRRPGLRLALANLHRPGAQTGSIVLSLGLAATVLVAIAAIQGTLVYRLGQQIPKVAPSFFFVDIQPHQVGLFDKTLRAVPGVSGLKRTAMIRARIAKLKGIPADKAVVADNARWALRNERGLTFASQPPEKDQIVAGRWWPKDYQGPPVISFDANLAKGMGLNVGDTITFNILGRNIQAKIANLRKIHWQSLGLSFTTIFAPGTLEKAPHTYIATARLPVANEAALLTDLARALPNVSAIPVRDALDTAKNLLGNIGFALRLTAGVTLIAGLLVLAGAVAAGQRRRRYDAVVFKVLGAARGRLLRTFLLEYGILGSATAVVAMILGNLTAWAVLTLAMGARWIFLPGSALQIGGLALLITLLFGFWGIWNALGQKASPLLRND